MVGHFFNKTIYDQSVTLSEKTRDVTVAKLQLSILYLVWLQIFIVCKNNLNIV